MKTTNIKFRVFPWGVLRGIEGKAEGWVGEEHMAMRVTSEFTNSWVLEFCSVSPYL